MTNGNGQRPEVRSAQALRARIARTCYIEDGKRRPILSKGQIELYSCAIRKADEVLRPEKGSNVANLIEARTPAFLAYLIGQCEQAKIHSYPERERRKLDTEALEGAKTAERQARYLANYLREFQHAAKWALLDTMVVEKLSIDRQASEEPVDQVLALSDLLDGFSRSLREGNLMARRGDFAHRFLCAPLWFPSPKEGMAATEPDPRTALALFLVFLTWRFLANGSWRWGLGETIVAPTAPIWPLIEELVFVTLGGERIGLQIAIQFYRRNKQAQIAGFNVLQGGS
jgi:hypothetical protein